MSATNRGAVRHTNDFYETEAWVVDSFLDANSMLLNYPYWLEPASGNGAIVSAVNHYADRDGRQRPTWTEVDIAPQCMPSGRNIILGDFLDPKTLGEPPGRWGVMMTNPPYKLAQEFIERGLEVANNVVVLLRLNFLEGQKRSAWLREHVPDVYVLPKRPSFTGDGKTDATAYAWMVFWPGGSRSGRIEILDLPEPPPRIQKRVISRSSNAILNAPL
jgi:hypothetical protein